MKEHAAYHLPETRRHEREIATLPGFERLVIAEHVVLGVLAGHGNRLSQSDIRRIYGPDGILDMGPD